MPGVLLASATPTIEESMTEPDTDLDPENQLGLPENRGWV